MFGKDFILDPKPAAQKGSGSIGSSSSSGNKEIDLSDPSASGPVSLNTGYLSSLFNFTSIFSPVLIWCSEIKVRISNKKCFKIVGKACGKLKSWCEGHISTGQVVVKGIGFACFGFLLFQKLSAWYRQIGETEIILDRTDDNYKSYGCNMNGIGVSYLAGLNYTAIDEAGYSDLFRKLESIIQIPRFPQTLKDYSLLIGKEVADLISSVEKQLSVRLHSDFLAHQRLVMSPTEIEVLKSFQRGIVLLQTRQADATIRQLRLHILDAANQCEDLVSELNRKAVERSQNMRLASNLPLPRFISTHIPFVPVSKGIRASTLDRLRKVIGKEASSSSIVRREGEKRGGDGRLEVGSSMYVDTEDFQDMVRAPHSSANPNGREKRSRKRSNNIVNDVRNLHMNTREKGMLLEGLLHSLYTTAGHLQLHLDRYHHIREHFIKSTDLVDKKDPKHEEPYHPSGGWLVAETTHQNRGKLGGRPQGDW